MSVLLLPALCLLDYHRYGRVFDDDPDVDRVVHATEDAALVRVGDVDELE